MTISTTITKTVAAASLATAVLLGGAVGTAGAAVAPAPAPRVELRAGDSVKQIAAGSQDTAITKRVWDYIRFS